MKDTRLESSRPLSLPEPVSAGLSVLLHVVLVFGTLHVSSRLQQLPPDDTPESARFLYPLLKPMPRPVEERVSFVGLGGTLPAEVAVRTTPAPVKPVEPPLAELPVPETRAEEPPRTFSEVEVDSAAVRDPESVGPVYPQKLLEARIEGATLVQFVVDSTGRVDPTTIIVMESTHDAFTEAVRDVLPHMKFQPARVGRRPVAQLVQQRFGFRIVPPL